METDIRICLTEAEQARAFVEAAERFQSDIDLVCGRYIVNAKSMLGVLSLVSSDGMRAEIHSEDADETAAFLQAMQPFSVSG